MSQPLAGRVALVTGTSRGIGRALAEALAGAGAVVACTARSIDDARATAAALGGKTRGFKLDVTRRDEILAAVRDVERELGPIDILFNNAGITQEKASVDLSDDEWDLMIETNLSSLFRCARAVAPGMISRGRGKIINIGSMYGRMGVARYLAYCTTKAAIDGLTKSLAVEWARDNIQVNCLAPGYVNTDIPKAAMENDRTRAIFLSKVPARRIAQPEEIGPLAVYLASSASDFMTGQTVYLDGGQTISW